MRRIRLHINFELRSCPGTRISAYDGRAHIECLGPHFSTRSLPSTASSAPAVRTAFRTSTPFMDAYSIAHPLPLSLPSA